MIDDLHELLALRGHEVSSVSGGEARGFEVNGTHVLFTPAFRGEQDLPSDTGKAVVLTLEVRGRNFPEGTAVLDLGERKLHGSGGVVLDTVREFCRKRGIRFDPGPWRYGGGLI
jgi:hypothetical protein